MSERRGSGETPAFDDDNQLQFTFPAILSMELEDGLALVWKARGSGWTVTQYTDANPAAGAVRDVEDNVRWILSRCAA